MQKKLNATQLAKFAKKSFLRSLMDISLDWSVIIGAVYLSSLHRNPVTFLLAILIVGNRQHALVILGHEGAHFMLAKKRRINDLIANIFAMWPVGLTISGYRKLHSMHHQNLGTDGDPELHHKRSRAPQWDLPIKAGQIAKYALLDLVGGSLQDYKIIVQYSKPEFRRDTVFLVIAHCTFILFCLGFKQWWILAVWYSSLLSAFMMYFRLRLWLEHQGEDATTRLHLTRLQGALLSPHYAWYHWEHHKWANVPYYNLPKIRKLISNYNVISLQQLLQNLVKASSRKSGAAMTQLSPE